MSVFGWEGLELGETSIGKDANSGGQNVERLLQELHKTFKRLEANTRGLGLKSRLDSKA